VTLRLAVVLVSLDELDDAQALYERVLDHKPDQKRAIAGLAEILKRRGDFDAAQELLESCAGTALLRFGANHPQTLDRLTSVAHLRLERGDYEGARLLYEDLAGRYLPILGIEHSLTRSNLSGYASSLQGLGRFNDAEPFYKMVLDAETAILGEGHPRAIAAINNWASCMIAQRKDMNEVRKILEQTSSLAADKLGLDHNLSLAVLNNLAHTLIALDQRDAATSLLTRVGATLADKLGQDHFRTRSVLHNLARLKSG
jgi:tetratricopeptide (TPR) repeat protein